MSLDRRQPSEDIREARVVRFVHDALGDLRYAGRMMMRSPGVTAVAVLSLALGIGANTAIFSAVDELMLQTLPVAKPERLVMFYAADDGPARGDSLPYPQFEQLQRHLSNVFASVTAIWSIDRANMTVNPAPGVVSSAAEPDAGLVRVGLAAGNYFETLGVRIQIGRGFTSSDNRVPGGHPLAVISDAYWDRRFGRSRDITDRTFSMNGVTYQIVGVTARGFSGEWVGMPTDFWVPFMMASEVMPEVPGGPRLYPSRVLARLADGVTIAQARAASQVLYQQVLRESAGVALTDERAAQIARQRVELESAAKGYSPQRRSFAQPLGILMAAVGLLLLIACANLANLLLARSAARQREFSVRLAIGAGHARLTRQLLTESALLALLGGAAGTVFAVWASTALATMVAAAPVSLAGQGTGLLFEMHIDARTLAFTLGLCVVTTALFGIAPALSASATSIAPALSERGNTGGSRAGRGGPSRLLVITQVALSLVLLVGAALFVRTLRNLEAQDLGIERSHVLLVWTVPGQTGRLDTAAAELWRTVQERLSMLPGVASAGAANQAVLSGAVLQGRASVPLRIAGEAPKPTTRSGGRTFVTSQFFATLGIPFVDGRDFTERDNESAPRVVIINEAMARFYFGNRRAVGQHAFFPPDDRIPVEIVGVVKDFVRGTPRTAAQPEFITYFPYRDREAINRGAQTRLRVMMMALRTSGDPAALATLVRRELHAIDPMLPILRINTVQEQLDDVLAQDRLVAALSTFFGVAAVLVASLGLFGLVSYGVTRRKTEIGVRLALGATPRTVLQMVLNESMRPVVLGVLIGIPAALLAARAVATRLYGIGAMDAMTIVGATLLLLLVGLAAAALPARRAARLDPTTALRCD